MATPDEDEAEGREEALGSIKTWVERFGTVEDAEEFVATVSDAEAGDYSIDGRTG